MAFIIADLVIDHDKAPPSLRWDHDRGVCGTGTSSSSGKTVITGPCGTSSPGMTTMGGGGGRNETGTSSSSGGTTIVGPCGTGTSSNSDGTATVTGCDNETSSSLTHMHFALGTSSSSTCMMPNSSFIISNVICKNRNIPK
jgi:hypothetical protein